MQENVTRARSNPERHRARLVRISKKQHEDCGATRFHAFTNPASQDPGRSQKYGLAALQFHTLMKSIGMQLRAPNFPKTNTCLWLPRARDSETCRVMRSLS